MVKVVEIPDGHILARQGRPELLGHRFEQVDAVQIKGENHRVAADRIEQQRVRPAFDDR